MMEGAWQAKTLVTDYLNSDLPTRLIRFRNHWEKDDILLPTPEKIVQFEPLTLDTWPTLITLVTGTQGVTREDYDDAGNPIYRVRYAMRTYIWVRAEQPDRVTMIRDDLTTVVRDALVDHPALRSLDRYEHCEAFVDEGTVREEFSDLTLLKGDRYLAGAYVSYDMSVSETVTREPLSDSLALTFDVDVYQIEKIPNAPTLVIALPGDEIANLTWKAPTWDGGVAPIDHYRIEMSTDGGDNWATLVSDTGNTVPAYEVTGLDNGSEYQFRVAAVNRIGIGATSSPSNVVTPAVPS